MTTRRKLLTAAALAGVGYAYGAHRQHAVVIGHRYMDIRFKESTDLQGDVDTEVQLAGFFGAFKFGF